MARSPNTEHRRREAFTLLELLVSMAILSILVVILSQMINQASTAWARGESNKERMQDARAVVEFMSNELQSALLPVNRPTQTGIQFVVNPAAITSGTFNNRDSVFWQTPQATDQTQGDVAEVGYFVRWDATVSSNPRPILCRFFVNPGDTNFLIYSTDPDTPWLSKKMLDAVAPGIKSNDPLKNYLGLFAENVLGLWVTALDPIGQPITLDATGANITGSFDSRMGYKYTDSNGATQIQSACSLPAAIDLGLVTLDSRSAKRITPGLQAKIQTLAATSASAQAFVASAQSDPAFLPIIQGLRYFQTKVFLQNSK